MLGNVPLAPLRVLVAASTHAGVTIRLKTKKARQYQLASHFLLAPVARSASNNVLRDGPISSQIKSGSTSGAMRFFWFDGVCH